VQLVLHLQQPLGLFLLEALERDAGHLATVSAIDFSSTAVDLRAISRAIPSGSDPSSCAAYRLVAQLGGLLEVLRS
jgi:hypothetical protein